MGNMLQDSFRNTALYLNSQLSYNAVIFTIPRGWGTRRDAVHSAYQLVKSAPQRLGRVEAASPPLVVRVKRRGRRFYFLPSNASFRLREKQRIRAKQASGRRKDRLTPNA